MWLPAGPKIDTRARTPHHEGPTPSNVNPSTTTMSSFTVHCDHCGAGFPVDPAKVPDGGVRARCTSCEGIFFVDVPEASEAHDDGIAPEFVAGGSVAAATMVEAAVGDSDGGEDGLAAEPVIEGEVEPSSEGAEVEEGADWDPDEADDLDDLELVGFDDEPHLAEMEAAVEDSPGFAEEVAEVEADVSAEAYAAEPDAPAAEEPAAEVDDPGLDEIGGGLTFEQDDRTFSGADGEEAVAEPLADAEPDPEPEPLDDGLELADDMGFTTFDDAPSMEETAAEVVESGDDWVVETEERTPTAEVEVDPLDTVEAQVRGFQDETYEAPESEGIERVVPGQEEETFSGYTAPDTGPSTIDPVAEAAPTAEPEQTPVESASEAAAEEAAAEAPAKAPAFTFGKRDPHDKAKRLARVLVSDMITYNPDRHARALENRTLKEDFEDEISKSWQEYVDQVGQEIAESTDYWTQALNDVLAKGEKVF